MNDIASFKQNQKKQIDNLVDQEKVAQSKFNVMQKMFKDFPASDDVRFEFQDAINNLNIIKKQLLMLK